jgi:hypothetical protein
MASSDAEVADVVDALPAHGAVEDALLEFTLEVDLHRQQLGAEHLRRDDDLRPVEPAAKSSSTIASAFAACSVTRRIARPRTHVRWAASANPGDGERRRETRTIPEPRSTSEPSSESRAQVAKVREPEAGIDEQTDDGLVPTTVEGLGGSRLEQLAKVLRRRTGCLLDVRHLSLVGGEAVICS